MKLPLYQLYIIKEKMEDINLTDDAMYEKLCRRIEKEESLLEDTSATGGPAVTAGMGAVVNAQPSGLAGATIGTAWASHGGTEGSGDISVPYNPSGANRVFQKIPAMGYNHGPRTGKKSRTKKLDRKHLHDFINRVKTDTGERKSKVLSFQDFLKNDINTVKK